MITTKQRASNQISFRTACSVMEIGFENELHVPLSRHICAIWDYCSSLSKDKLTLTNVASSTPLMTDW